MDTQFLIEQGNTHRSERRYQEALQCYVLAAAQDPENPAAFNNYGNVTRELGYPQRAQPWLEHALRLSPDFVTARFNLAVSALLAGDYPRGWSLYESRWQYEHLAGTLPDHAKPRWAGQDLQDKTLLVLGEQGHGDIIMMSRFLWHAHQRGARILLQVNANLIPLFGNSTVISQMILPGQTAPPFDYWTPIMSLPGVLGVTLENLPRGNSYLNARHDLVTAWQEILGAKKKLRAALAWRGRPDSWLNQHKGVPFLSVADLVQSHANIEWHVLQMDATDDEIRTLADLGCNIHTDRIHHWADTAALLHHCDVVISADTALAHLGGALGRPTWVMLNRFAQDWRWLLGRDDSPWYASVRLFRQPEYDAWQPVVDRVSQYLGWFKV